MKFLKKLFPIRAKSLDDFMSIVQREKGDYVTAESQTRLMPFYTTIGFTTFVSSMNYFSFIRFESETFKGRPIVFDEVQCLGLGIKDGSIDTGDIKKYAVNNLDEVLDELKRIKEKLPNIKTVL